MEEKAVSKCAARNVHGRTADDIAKLAKAWEPTPEHFNLLDIKTYLQDKVRNVGGRAVAPRYIE
jgi:hypothetical protein